jgi:hypothetical protein
MWILLAFALSELARWLSKLKIMRSCGTRPDVEASCKRSVKRTNDSAKGKARQSKCGRL